MHVELADLFRCTAVHEDSWLVAAAYESVERVIMNGVLGCPVCGAEYPIIDGETNFAAGHERAAGEPLDAAGTFRLAAQLDLSAPGKTVVLIGYDMQSALALQQLVPCRVVVVNGPRGMIEQDGAVIARIRCGDTVPVANASLHGIATRLDHLPANFLQLLRAGGRLVASAGIAIPPGTSEIARDHLEWVVARDAVTSAPVSLSRRQPSE